MYDYLTYLQMKKAFIESKKHLFPPTYHDEVPSHLLTKLIDINNNHHIFFVSINFFFLVYLN